MKFIKYIQDEIYGMAFDRATCLKQLSKYSEALSVHLIKCVLYPDNISYRKWIYKEIANWLQKASTYKLKKGKLKYGDYLDTIFDYMGTTQTDAENNIETFFLDQKHETNPYPRIEITSELSKKLFNVYNYIKKYCIPTYLDNKDHDISEYVHITLSALNQ